MLKRFITILLVASAFSTSAQQLIGLTTNNYVAVNQLQLNPAYVNNARFAPEFNLFSLSALAGNNAFSVSAKWLLSGDTAAAKEGQDYVKLTDNHRKKAWANVDIMGPAFSFTYKKKYQIGLYTRFRSIVNAGNVPYHAFEIYTSDPNDTTYFKHTLSFSKMGAVAHAFGEVGITVGKMLHEDEMYKISGGITVKYLVGFAAMNVYSKQLDYSRDGDTVYSTKGDITALYTYNTTPNNTGDLSQRAGKGGLGFDIGVQYHYFPEGDPNKEIPYRFSLAASITDIGSVGYVADAGSGKYEVNVNKANVQEFDMAETDNNEPLAYFTRLKTANIISKSEKVEKFRIGLPTAFRANADYNFGNGIYLSANTVINLRGNSSTVYRPAYISYINLTPRFEIYRSIKIGVPFTLYRYRDLGMGAIIYLGPLYVGTNNLTGVFFSQQVKNMDVFAGMGLRFIKHERDHSFTFDNGYDSEKGWKRLIPNFLRRDRSIVCPK